MINIASARTSKQVERTDVRVQGRRYAKLAGAVSLLAALSLMAASSAFASSVNSPLLVLSNYTASTKNVTYSVAFKTPHALVKGSSKITLQAPNGTKFGKCKKETCKVIDEPSSGSPRSGAVTKDSTTNEKATITITTPVSAAAGDRVIVHVPGSTNAGGVGAQSLSVSTTEDSTPASVSFDLSPEVLISQVRPNGPGGENDGYVELYAGGPSVNLSGYTLRAVASGGAQTTLVKFAGQKLNNNAEEPDNFLLAGGSTYSADALNASAPADVTFSSPIPANGAVALYDGANKLVDSVVFGTGTGLESTGVLGTYSNSTEEYAFVRKLDQQPGGKTGAPLYTGHNASDWTLVAPEAANPLTENSPLGTGSALKAFEGQPGPHNLNSAVIQNPNFTVSLLSGTESSAVPNTEVRTESASPHTTKTLYLRRTITYHGPCTVGNLKLRVSTISTDSNPAPAASQAILRVVSNPESGFTSGKQTYALAPTTLDSGGVDGGGLNSSLSLPGTELTTGQSVNLAIKLGVQRAGNYQFFFNVEGNTVGFCS